MSPRQRFLLVAGAYAAWLVALAVLAASSGIAPRQAVAASPDLGTATPVDGAVPR